MKKNQKTFDIIISIVLAIGLWFYVINTVNPVIKVTINNVPVQVSGADVLQKNGLAVASVDDASLYVEVSGTRNTVINLKASDINLKVDVSNTSEGTNNVQIAASMPDGVSLSDIERSTLVVVTEKYATVSKPVEVTLTGATKGEEPTVLSSSLTQIKVSGAQSIVDSVVAVKVTGDLSGVPLDTPTELSLAAAPVDARGKTVSDVTIAQSSVTVNAAVYQTKTVPLSVNVTGNIWKGAILESKEIPTSIVIKGPASKLSTISAVKAKDISISEIYETTRIDISPMLDRGIFASEAMGTLQASFVIAENGSLELSYKGSQVNVEGLGAGLSSSIVLPAGYSEIRAVVKGPVFTLRTLAAGEVAPTIDAAGKGQGYYSVTLVPSSRIDGISVVYAPATVSLSIQ